MSLPVDVHSLDAATEAIELAEAYAWPLDEAQCAALRAGLGTRSDGSWSADSVGICEPRQNGKGDIVQARELSGLFLRGEAIIHTAHEVPTSVNAFLRLVTVVEGSDELRRQVARIRYANGEQGIELKNGGRIMYRARTGGGGRGLDDIALVVYDEAQHLKAEQVAASSPTAATNRNSQMWALGSAGLAFSEVWWSLRRRALAGIRGRFAWVEHTAERVSLVDGKPVSAPIDVTDRANWALANPAYGYRIDPEFFEAQLALLGPELFAREHLGVWDALPDDVKALPVKLDPARWAATAGYVLPRSSPPLVLSFSVSRGGEWSSIAIGAGALSAPYVEVVEHRQGVGWLPGRVAELAKQYEIPVGCNAAGATGGQVGPVQLALTEAGVSDPVRQLSGREYWQACAGFFADVVEGRLRRPSGQGPLDVAAADAAERVSGDQWQWDQRNATVPLSPLEAVTVARALLPVSAKAEFFIF